MRSRKVALALSFIYCGLGQIYNGQIIKGVDFIIIYTVLLAGTFFASGWSHILSFSVLPFMWLMGMADAYTYEEGAIRGKKWLLVVPPAMVISLIVFGSQMWFMEDTHAGSDERIVTAPPAELNASVEDTAPPDSSENTQTQDRPVNLYCFSIQAGTFRDLANAQKFRDELLYKGYPARIEESSSANGTWYRVLIGQYETRHDAVPIAKELRERERIFYIIVRCRIKEQKEPTESS